MYKVLLCDDNEFFLEVLEKRIESESEFKVVAKAQDGKSAIELIEQLLPEIIVLDIVMPGSDGVYIVNHIRNQMADYNPVIYILSGIGTSKIIKTLNALDIDFYSMKPVSLDIVMQNLKQILEKQNVRQKQDPAQELEEVPYKKPNLMETVKDIAIQLGILPHRLASKCTVDAVVYYLQNPDCYHVLTKILYPEIAKKYCLNSLSVERNIRNSIALMQETQTPLYKKVFAYSEGKRITNSEFLTVVSEYINRL